MGYSPWGLKVSNMTEKLDNNSNLKRSSGNFSNMARTSGLEVIGSSESFRVYFVFDLKPTSPMTHSREDAFLE